jgi:hypothetical protein
VFRYDEDNDAIIIPSSCTTRHLQMLSIVTISMVLLAALVSEWYSEQRRLYAEYDNFMINKPAFCEGNQPSSIVELVKHSLNFQYAQQCTVYHNYKTFGPSTPNPALVISSLFTKVFIIPTSAMLHIFASIAYITQVIIMTGALCITLLLSYYGIHYCINVRRISLLNATAALTRSRHHLKQDPTQRYVQWMQHQPPGPHLYTSQMPRVQPPETWHIIDHWKQRDLYASLQ